MFSVPPYLPPLLASNHTFRDLLAIKYPGYGYALWEPNPVRLYPAIQVGDVGCVHHGKFLRLFNALLPANHPFHEKSGVPESHEPLKPNIADHINTNTHRPENLYSAEVTEHTTSHKDAMQA